MDKTKTVAIISIIGFAVVAGLIVFVNRDKLFGGKEEAAPAAPANE